jgi:hypothetical protein
VCFVFFVVEHLSPRRAQRGRAATKENGNFHHEAHEGHEGKEIRRNFVPNFVLFVSFVVINFRRAREFSNTVVRRVSRARV